MAGNQARHIAFLSIFIALALVLHFVEGLLPPLGPPGAKLGLANLASLAALILWGWRAALVVTLSRVVLGSILGGTFLSFAFLLSLAGGLGSLLVMTLVLAVVRHADPRILGIAGAVTHNLCQLAAASLIIGMGMLYYLPALVFFAVPAGYFTGSIVWRMTPLFMERKG